MGFEKASLALFATVLHFTVLVPLNTSFSIRINVKASSEKYGAQGPHL